MFYETNWSGVVIWATFIIAPIMLVQNILYWYRRNLFPISGHFPGLSLFGSFVCLIKISLLAHASSISPPLPCWLLALDFSFLTGVFISTYLMRALSLSEAYFQQMKKRSLQKLRLATGMSMLEIQTTQSTDDIPATITKLDTNRTASNAKRGSTVVNVFPRDLSSIDTPDQQTAPNFNREARIRADAEKKSPRLQWLTIILYLSLLLLFISALLSSLDTTGSCSFGKVQVALNCLSFAVLFALSIIITYNLWKAPEAFQVIWEFSWALRLGVLGSTGAFIIYVEENLENQDVFRSPIFSLWIFGVICSFQILSISYPLFVSSNIVHAAMGLRRKSRFRLKDALKNKKLVELFRSFLESEFSTENLLFYEEVERFRTDFNFTSDFMQFLATETFVQNQIYQRSFDLYYTYTRAGSPLQVNISSKTIRELEKKMKLQDLPKDFIERYSNGMLSDDYINRVRLPALKIEIFDKAQKEVYVLMERDSWNRFSYSEKYLDFFKK